MKEKEPFYVGPYRSKSASPGRKPRGNSENVPPEHSNHVSLCPVTLEKSCCWLDAAKSKNLAAFLNYFLLFNP